MIYSTPDLQETLENSTPKPWTILVLYILPKNVMMIIIMARVPLILMPMVVLEFCLSKQVQGGICKKLKMA